MTTETVSVGIVGLGGIAGHHAERLADRNADLVGGVDIDAGARREFSEEWSVPTHDDLAAIIDDIDALLVTTPNRYHERYATTALDAGVDVLVEKPLAHSLDSAERIAAAAADSAGFCMVGFNYRFAAPVDVLTAYRDEGRFGEISHIEANYVRRRGIPGRGSWFTDRETAGGGALIDIGVHAIDLALCVLDFPDVVEVSATTRAEFGTREEYSYMHMWGDDEGPEAFDVEDSASAFLRTTDGATISLEVAWATNRPRTDEYVIRGSDAGAVYDRKSEELTLYETHTTGGQHFTETAVETPDRNSHAAELDYFLDHVADDSDPDRNTVEQGLAVQRVIDAVYRSADRGRAVELSESDE
ncbi:Gfo/Idh/MocA family protein [Halonotius roseus]|uniref:Gfo/Idh/MocA family oxidoreductase n=1 Tax=Halonotius roseus TaxID=2511997 RepID=A0A544QLJ2_9EURY|nr:Gfo/Idh/MocA family oxidoreductase [Halonotius roseus]TQQ79443.1 Gfo/Idh/MocA family oxidoreductase [Halonotius roseus]